MAHSTRFYQLARATEKSKLLLFAIGNLRQLEQVAILIWNHSNTIFRIPKFSFSKLESMQNARNDVHIAMSWKLFIDSPLPWSKLEAIKIK